MQDKDDYKYKFTIGKLEKCSYRVLQQKAKSLNLPSNYKKIYLIQLIHAKFFGSPEQVQSIVDHVRRERQQVSQTQEISSTSEESLRCPTTNLSSKQTPVIHYNSKARRRVIRPDYHEPQPLGKPRAYPSNNQTNVKTSFGTAPSCSDETYRPMPALGYRVNATTPKSKIPSYNLNSLKQYRPNTTTAPLKTYIVQKKPETDRVLRNRTFPTANQHKPEKYKDDTADFNTVPKRYGRNLNAMSKVYKDNANNLKAVSERNKDSAHNYNTESEIYKGNACNLNSVSERYKDNVGNLNCTILDLLQSRKPMPESNYSKFFKQSDDAKNQSSVGPSKSLLKHRPSILANDTAKLIQRSVERARVNRRLDDKFDNLRSVPNRTVLLPSMQTSPTRTSAKRQRTLSGIYPIEPEEPKPNQTYRFVQSGIGIRKSDGTYSKINALVRKPLPKGTVAPNYQKTTIGTYNNPRPLQEVCVVLDGDDGTQKSPEYNFQDVFASTVSTAYATLNSFVNTVTYTQTSASVQVYSTALPNCSVETSVYNEKENFLDDNDYTTYCHKKIRAEQVRSRRESVMSKKEMQRDEVQLPKIHEVFSGFSNVVNSATGPIFVQVGDEAGKDANATRDELRAPEFGTKLEVLYNFRAEFLPNAPLPAIATTGNTCCVYSTPVLTTAVAQSSNFAPNAQFHLSHDYQSEGLANDYPNNNYSYFRHSSDKSHSTTSSLEMLASQVEDINSSRTLSLTAAESIPDMVEDALELISQDGDYMERIEMDVVTSCVLCSWAGPRPLLEQHIRQEHPGDITQFRSRECRVACSLRQLAGGAARLLQRGGELLVLRASLARDWLVGSLHSVSHDEDRFEMATLSTYSNTTGEPHSWTGLIPSLDDPPDQALRVKLSKLNLDTSQAWERVFVSFYVKV